jgi:hypothetical protein
MQYVITRNTRADQDPPGAPNREDGGLYEYAMRFNGDSLYCFTDNVEVLAGALTGDVDGYLAMSEQDRLVARIKASLGYQCKRQAVINQQAMQTGRWDKCTETEKNILNGRRDVQPSGWSTDLLGADWWTAPVDLVLVSSGYAPWTSVPLPMTSGDRLWVIDPVTTEDWLSTLHDLGVIALHTCNA